MVITIDLIIKVSAAITAIGVIWTAIYAVIKWFQKQEKQSIDIENLRKKEAEDITKVKEEQCVLSYAMLAALDGLHQLGCNGEVTKAHTTLEKHLNQKAHDKK